MALSKAIKARLFVFSNVLLVFGGTSGDFLVGRYGRYDHSRLCGCCSFFLGILILTLILILTSSWAEPAIEILSGIEIVYSCLTSCGGACHHRC